MITKQIALSLRSGQILQHCTLKNADGTPVRARVNGRVQTWKTRVDEFKLPMKHGLKNCFYIDTSNAAQWSVD